MAKEIISAKLKTSFFFNDAVKDEAVASAVFKYIQKNKIVIPEDVITEVKNRFLALNRLNNDDDLNDFLNESGLTLTQFEIFIRKEASLKTIEDIVITDETVTEYFNEYSDRFKIIYADKYITKEINDIDRLISAPVYGTDINFDKTDEIIVRGDLPVGFESKVFNANEGDIVGPLKEEDHFVIYRITRIKQPLPDNLTKSKIKQGLFSLWLSSLLTSSK